jgi:hypothetical protein
MLVTHQHASGIKRWLRRGLAAVFAGLVFQADPAPAQPPVSIPAPFALSDEKAPTKAEAPKKNAVKTAAAQTAAPPNRTIHDPNVKKAQCTGCGGLLAPVLGCGSGGCGAGGNGKCVPGRQNCSWANYDTVWGRCIGGIYDCICCPDQCYEPRWLDVANAAFFQEGARPKTTTRLRWDSGFNYHLPDAAEYWWAKIGGRGPARAVNSVDWHEFSLYQEVGTGNFSTFVETPYRHVEYRPINAEADDPTGGTGFGDVKIGTKSLMLDCELMQIAFQFITYIPAGSATKGLGTGHVSLEPSVLATFKLADNCYLQTQFGEWIPLGGDADHSGAAFIYRFSLNKCLYRAPNNAAAIIGTFEFNGMSFQDGLATEPDGTVRSVSGQSLFHLGPGVRFSLCDKLDVGMGWNVGVNDHGPDNIYRWDIRFRY